MPCAPFTPTFAISIRVLELYRNSHLRCPHLTIQPFVKGLCDLHGVSAQSFVGNMMSYPSYQLPFRPYLSQQFTICFDLYLSIWEAVRKRVQRALNRDTRHWRLRHTCPACSYKIQGEDDLIFKMLITMDGGDSLKRLLRRDACSVPAPGSEKDGQEVILGRSCESKDSRKVAGDYYIDRERVNRWAKAMLEEMLPSSADMVSYELFYAVSC